jgi:hypothetical protein
VGFFDDVVSVAQDVIDAPGNAVSSALDDIRSQVPQAAFVIDGFRKLESYTDDLPGIGKPNLHDVVSHLDWRSIVGKLQGALSTVPVIGTAASDVLATGLVAYDVLTSSNKLEAALRTAYEYAIGTAPGIATYRWALDPMFDAIVRMAVGSETPSSALVHALVDDTPDAPHFGDITPRSIAAALAQVVIAHRDIRDVGVDLVSEASGAAGDVAQRATRAALQSARNGKSPAESLLIAADSVAVPAIERAGWDEVRGELKALGKDVLPEDVLALGTQGQGLADAVSQLWPKGAGVTPEARVKNMMSRDYEATLRTEGLIEHVDEAQWRKVVSLLPPGRHATSDELSSAVIRGARAAWEGANLSEAALRAAEPKRRLLVGHSSLETPLDALEKLLRRAKVNLKGAVKL